jgi:hypothetical protein
MNRTLTSFALPQFLTDFVLSLVDINFARQPRCIHTALDAFAGIAYLAIFTVSLVFAHTRGTGGQGTDATIIAR